jgi:hypothetical protein
MSRPPAVKIDTKAADSISANVSSGVYKPKEFFQSQIERRTVRRGILLPQFISWASVR